MAAAAVKNPVTISFGSQLLPGPAAISCRFWAFWPLVCWATG
jgi:hypothetical protein